jgi:uncharacterized protein (DUF1330 family)
MPAYMIARVQVTDPTRYAEYVKRSPAAIAAFGGRFISRGAEVHTLEGEAETRRLVIVEFPSVEQAKAAFASERYQLARTLRAGAADAQFIVVDGYPEEKWAETLAASEALG